MTDITLQMSFDSSYIDFNIDSEEKFLHKVSLLSVGNSYFTLPDIEFPESDIRALREYLLPRGKKENDQPTHLRVWGVYYDAVALKYKLGNQSLNFPINPVAAPTIDESWLVKEYYVGLLEEQVQNKDHLSFEIIKGIDIEIDEDYSDDSKKTKGKAHSATAQMAQKFFPYNEKLDFLYLSADDSNLLSVIEAQLEIEDGTGFETIQNFYTEITDNAGFIFFPVSNVDGSLWYVPETVMPSLINNNTIDSKDELLATLPYSNSIALNDFNINSVAYTKPTLLPELNTPKDDAVVLRKNGKYIGEVAIVVEQDNDWKVNFTERLARVLDLREVFLGDKTIEETIKNTASITNALESFLTPFLNLAAVEETTGAALMTPQFWLSIEKLIIATVVSKSKDHSKLEKEMQLAKTNCDSYRTQINQNLQNDTNHEKLKWIISKLLLQDEDLFQYASYVEKPTAFKEAIKKLYEAFQSNKNQTSLLSVLAILDFTQIDISTKATLKIENETVVYQFADPAKINIVIPIIEVFNFDIFYLFSSYILLYGKKEEGVDKESLLTYLLNKDSFDISNLKTEISLKINELLVDSSNNLKLTYAAPLKTLSKQDTIDSVELEKFITATINAISNNKGEIQSNDKIQPTNDQVPVRIQIGKPTQVVPGHKDDLSDELSGYVLLNTRSKKINDETDFNDWKHNNWTKVKRNVKGTEDTNAMESSFLLPSYLPVEDNVQKIFLEISNEKASLVATLENIKKGISEKSVEKKSNLIHLLEKTGENQKHNPYLLLYGFHYQFAAFAILNSGVLPEVLRKTPEALNEFREDGFNLNNVARQHYHYLRTNKVSSPGFIPNNVKKYPTGLNPLYFELFGEGENQRNHKNELIIVGDKFNDTFSFTVQKPKTSYWDCFSFVQNGIDMTTDKLLPFKIINPEISKLSGTEYIDPSVSEKLYIEVQHKFAISGSLSPVSTQILTYDKKTNDTNPKLLNHIKEIYVKLEAVAGQGGTINLKSGGIYSVKFCNLIETKYFNQGSDHRFHQCLFDLYKLGPDKIIKDQGIEYYKISFEEQLIETASDLNLINEDEQSKGYVWKQLQFSEQLQGTNNTLDKLRQSTLYVNLNIEEPKKFILYSRVVVAHQRWDWNGRQINTDLKELAKNLNPDVTNPTTSKGMEFDAWEFADRQDSSSVFKESRIMASLDEKIWKQEERVVLKPNVQIINDYPALIDNHAMYFRYKIELFNRYESLGARYASKTAKSQLKVDGIDNPWKRYLKLSKRVESLPIPAVRFYIPLTNSIKEAEDYNNHIADTMLVMDDVWYKEAGLAQKLNLGIQVARDPNTNQDYPEAGFDPTLSKITTKILTKSDKVEEEYLVIDDKHIKGPFGFTFDFNAANSRINSSSFIISGDGLSSYIGDESEKKQHYWPMFKLAVRSDVLTELNENSTEGKLRSKWSSPQWVQFMKAIDSFIPVEWREQVRKTGRVDVSNPMNDITPNLFNRFGETFWQYHNWYLIFSTLESNIGGLPVENYYDTFIVNGINTDLTSLQSVHSSKDIKEFSEGYVRIMVVRKSDDYDSSKKSEDIWNELFGKKNDAIIKEDNTLAIPILSERIPITIKK